MLNKSKLTWKACLMHVWKVGIIALAVLQLYSWSPWKIQIKLLPVLTPGILFLDGNRTFSYFKQPQSRQKTDVSLHAFLAGSEREVSLPLVISDVMIGDTYVEPCGVNETGMTLILTNGQEVTKFLRMVQVEWERARATRCVLQFDTGAFYSVQLNGAFLVDVEQICLMWYGVERGALLQLVQSIDVTGSP